MEDCGLLTPAASAYASSADRPAMGLRGLVGLVGPVGLIGGLVYPFAYSPDQLFEFGREYDCEGAILGSYTFSTGSMILARLPRLLGV